MGQNFDKKRVMSNYSNVQEKLNLYATDSSVDLTDNEYKILLSGKIDSEIITIIYELLICKKIDPNRLFLILIAIIKTEEHLPCLSLCLRYGADPNMYVKYKDTDIHVLVYVHINYGDKVDQLKNTILLLLLLSGSDPSLGYSSKSKVSVIKHLSDNKITNFLHIAGSIQGSVDQKLLLKLAVLLDNPQLLSNNSSVNLTEIIRDYSNDIFRAVIQNLDHSKIIDLCIKYHNLEAFKICLNVGVNVKYHQINIICLQAKLGNKFVKSINKKMIIEYINHGGKIDLYQSKILIPTEIMNNYQFDNNLIMEYLNNPLLLKSGIPEMKVPNIFLKKSYIEAGKKYGPDARLSTSPIDKTIIDYIDLCYYKDSLVFTPDMFEKLLNDKIVPYSLSPAEKEFLNDDFINSLSIQRGLLKRLGFNINKNSYPTNLPVDDLKFSRLELAFSAFINYNTNKEYSDLSVMDMEKLLVDIGINSALLNLLNAEHYKRTFAISCYEKLNEQTELILKRYSLV